MAEAQSKSKVIILEDDPIFLEGIVITLEKVFEVKPFLDYNQLVDEITDPSFPKYDLLISDFKLDSDVSLLNLLEDKKFKKACAGMPILCCSGYPDEEVIEDLFSQGIVDFLTKPIDWTELTVKSKRIVNNTVTTSNNNKTFKDIKMNPMKKIAVRPNGSKTKELTGREFQILLNLVGNASGIAKKSEMVDQIWGFTSVEEKTLLVHMSNLRKKIKPIKIGIKYDHDGETYNLHELH